MFFKTFRPALAGPKLTQPRLLGFRCYTYFCYLGSKEPKLRFLCSDFSAFSDFHAFKIVYVQSFVDMLHMPRLWWIQMDLCPDLLAFKSFFTGSFCIQKRLCLDSHAFKLPKSKFLFRSKLHMS